MLSFTINWIFTTFFIVLSFYFFSKMYFFSILLNKTKKENVRLKKKNINDSVSLEIIEKEIKNNKDKLDFLEEELINSYLVIKDYKYKNQSLETEIKHLEDNAKEMKSKIEMLF